MEERGIESLLVGVLARRKGEMSGPIFFALMICLF